MDRYLTGEGRQMKKIGILTLSASDNCGSLLQAYALQTILQDRGDDVEIIDLVTPISKKMYRVIHPGYIRYPKMFFGQIIRYKDLIKQKRDYELFRQGQLRLTGQKYRSIDGLKAVDGKYDVIVCGSDQIWNIYMRDFDEAFLLSWCIKSRRISYAASLGDQKDGRLADMVERGFEYDRYAAVSVREGSAARKFKEELNKDVEICLDPTLLLHKDQWRKLIDKNGIPKERFIFYYSYDYADDAKNQMVQRASSETGLPVYVINASRWIDGRERKYGFHIFEQAGPLAFLALMDGCTYALVESFHGVAFAYIFQKEFWFLGRKVRLDDRIKDLLEIIDKRDRVLYPGKVDLSSYGSISYQTVPTRFKELVQDSERYIAENI